MSTDLTTAAREYHELSKQLADHKLASESETKRLLFEMEQRHKVLKFSEAGIDPDKVALAETVVFATNFAKAGTDRQSCIDDAVYQLSTGKSRVYANLWTDYFGTKDYDRWHGQRSDHPYWAGPRHGSTIFELGFTRGTRERDPKELTPEETESAIYYFLNLPRIQLAQETAKQFAASPETTGKEGV